MRSGALDLWETRMARAARLIGERLDDPPSLNEMAQAAAVSPFHFHRMWRALTGETTAATVRRLRLTGAATALTDTTAPVTQIGLDAGFATPQGFARAFRSTLGISPSDFRSGASPDPKTESDAAIEVVWIDAVTVVAKRRTGGPYEALNATFQAVWDWGVEAGRSDALRGLYGVPWDDPVSVPVEALRYDAAMDFGPDAPPTAPLHALVLGGCEHARARLVGSYDGIEAATQALAAQVLRSGREPADAPIFHHFHNDPESTAQADLLTDILWPLKSES